MTSRHCNTLATVRTTTINKFAEKKLTLLTQKIRYFDLERNDLSFRFRV